MVLRKLSKQRKKFWIEVLMLLVLATSPFLFYLYTLAPEDKKIISLFGYDFEAKNFSDFNLFLFYVGNKVLPIILLSIWFIFNRNRWYILILIPLLMYHYQLALVLNTAEFGYFVSQWHLFYFVGSISIVVLLLLRILLINYFSLDDLRREMSFLIDKIGKNFYKKTANVYQKLVNNKSILSYKNQLYELLRLRHAVDNSGHVHLNLKEKKSNKWQDYFFSIMLISSPLITYSYLLIPEGTSQIDLFFFNLHSGSFLSVDVLIWYVLSKLIPFLLLSIWFISSNDWWKYAVLIPSTIYLFQFRSGMLSRSRVDEYEFIQSLPITIPIILLLIWLSRKMNYVSLTKDLILEIEKEINRTLDQLANQEREKEKRSFTEKLAHLKATKSQYTKDEYLLQMVKLRNEIE
ncbi:hypothetical protein [Spongiivirga citrea]|uniref:Uncharacterized protein n=1 Tax=Spongiivirga citrea TaxID=1481457 RepID=A0A6M0CI53_9FLAO|nr:hypothetical protein [Spongiivirga citrea]NER15609.1 hypothetical protein [Spongiivirga citrea]